MRSLRWNSLSLSSQWSEKAQEKREVSVLKTTERERKERFWSSFWRFLTSLLSRAFSLPLCFCVCSRCFPSHKTNRRRLKREVCFENNNRERESTRERERFWSVLLSRALLCSSVCLPLCLVCFPHKTNWLTRQRDKNATIFITIGLVVGATIGRQINLGNSQRRRRKRRGTFDDDEREEYDDKQRQRWRQMGES